MKHGFLNLNEKCLNKSIRRQNVQKKEFNINLDWKSACKRLITWISCILKYNLFIGNSFIDLLLDDHL